MMDNNALVKLEIQKKIPNFVVQYVDNNEIWASSNHTIFRSTIGVNDFKKFCSLPVPFYSRFAGSSNLLSRSLRLGVKSILKLKDGTILAIANKKIFRIKNGELSVVHSFDKGSGPLRKGWCEDNNGNCYFGEYFLNNKRNSSVKLFKSSDNGKKWDSIQAFENIRHVHALQFDPFSGNLWLCTGDRDDESSIMFSEDEGDSWVPIASGKQIFRTVSLLFTKKHVYWGTDAPSKQNYICRYSRDNGAIDKLAPVDGPVHYSINVGNQFKLFSTAVEGNSEGNSMEWDKDAHIWASMDANRWNSIIDWKKDSWPYILGYGKILFPNGQNNTNDLYLTPQALKTVDTMLIHAKLHRSK